MTALKDVLPASDTRWFRTVLGHHPTGVAVVTAMTADGLPVGMVVGSFGSVSLEPPLVSFMPARSSSTWPLIRERGSFSVNVLAGSQAALCRHIATATPAQRFVGVDWQISAAGTPHLRGCLAWIDCSLQSVHAAGDHDIAIGAVERLAVDPEPAAPLVFFRGAYGRYAGPAEPEPAPAPAPRSERTSS